MFTCSCLIHYSGDRCETALDLPVVTGRPHEGKSDSNGRWLKVYKIVH